MTNEWQIEFSNGLKKQIGNKEYLYNLITDSFIIEKQQI